MASTSAASLRDLYSSPQQPWSFLPPPQNGSASPSPPINSSSLSDTATTTTYTWSTHPPPNSIYDLAPGLNLEPSVPNIRLLARTILASALLQYMSTGIAMPWEVGRILLQVQYVPRDVGVSAAPAEDADIVQVEEDESQEVRESSIDIEDVYFTEDVTPGAPLARFHPPRQRQTDEQGYVVRQSVADTELRPEYVIPVGSADGVWSMMKCVGRWRPEGWLALWKGTCQLTSYCIDFLSGTLQPIVQAILGGVVSQIYPSHGPILVPLASHILTGLILSPFDLVRTRLIAQTSQTRHKRYTGPLDALSQISRDEGGVRAMYFHPQLLYPALLDCTLRPLAGLAAEAGAARLLGPAATPDTHPIVWSLAQLATGCATFLVILPVETVRRRLQVQTRGIASPLKTCVETRPRPYFGVVDTLYSILSEERSDLPLKTSDARKRRRASKSGDKGKSKEGASLVDPDGDGGSWLRHTGVGQLYRGLGMRVGGSVLAFILQMVSAGPDVDDGWTEL
ncbi:mitochondrial carrier [Rickenella mellea]|uniref:Mitochondrial carrier n=1 Tax=Rickenella mellea TaxID=50990 RepID=A0A4Y7QM91_9AGAM|nr:mitochondrial carrier [Rickenella mellea]